MFLTKEAVRLAIPGYGQAVACDGCPPLPELGGTIPMWEWIGDEAATTFSC